MYGPVFAPTSSGCPASEPFELRPGSISRVSGRSSIACGRRKVLVKEKFADFLSLTKLDVLWFAEVMFLLKISCFTSVTHQ